VRQALQYAYPHVEVRQTEGGVTAADIATGIIAPSLDGYDKRDLYKTKDQNGDPATTRQLLAEAGVRDLSLTLDVPETPEALVTAAVVAAAYRQAGVTLTVVPGRSGATRADLTLVEHLPVLPTAEGVISMLDDCALCDPTLQVLRQQALAETDLKKADKLFAKVDEMVMEQALVLPRYFTKTLTVHGSAVRNTTPAAGYAGLPDLVNLAVR
jgi:peptide/nickel transport system substrate-binding protein